MQQPRLAVDPRLRLFDLIAEPLRAAKRGNEAAARVTALTGGGWPITPELLHRHPHEVSDGQLQRACLARALIGRPCHLVCDEMTSMLNASTQARFVVFALSHNETLLTHWCDHILHP